MEQSRVSMVAGILDIISAVFKLFLVFGLIITVIAAESSPYVGMFRTVWGFPANIIAILWTIMIPLAILGILAMVGGIYALQGRNWPLALAGSIAAALPFSVVGIAAFIITVLARNEFQ